MKIEGKQLINIKIPFFKDGSLIYEESTHTLRVSDRYYRCDLNCRGKCEQKNEKQIKKIDLEKRFHNLSLKFRFKQEKGSAIGEELLNKYLPKILLDSTFNSGRQEVLDTTLKVMDEDEKNITSVRSEDLYIKTGKFKGGGKIKKEDIKTFKDTFVKQQKEFEPLYLFGLLLSYIKTLSNLQFEKHTGHNLSQIIKKIYLSNEGKIVKIEFENFGWYILNYINRYIPDYLFIIKNDVEISNPKNDFLSLEIEEAIKYFEEDSLEVKSKDLGSNALYDLLNIPKIILSGAKSSPEDLQKATLHFFNFINSDPAAQFIAPIIPFLGKSVKIRKKKPHN